MAHAIHVIDIAEAHILALEKIKNELDNLNFTQKIHNFLNKIVLNIILD